MVSVVIAQRNEPYLKQTVASIVKACGGKRPEVIVVNDGTPERHPDVPRWVRVETPWATPRGCQAARDWGVVNARHAVCVVIDGHMDFDIGLFGGYLEHLKEHPQDILCAHTPGLNPETWERQQHVCSGAFVLWSDGGNTALSLKWRYAYDTGEIPAVLGACYGIDRDWYMEGLQRPWQYGTGWGCDEEVISIANWLCGGRCIVMPFDAAHWFRSQGQLPYPVDGLHLAGYLANRIRLVQMLPMPEPWRAELLGALHNAGDYRMLHDGVEKFLTRSDPLEYRAWLELQSRKFEDWRREFCSDHNPQDHPQFTPPGIRVTALEPPAMLLVQPSTLAADAEKKAQQERAYAPPPLRKPPEKNLVVVNPGVRCPHCHALYDHKVTHSYPNGNQRRICSRCARPFISMRIDEGRC